MRNQPKYHIFSNTLYAFSGLKGAFLNEASFRLEIVCIGVLVLLVCFSPIAMHYKMILSVSLFIPLVIELINSSIERIVDLVTLEHHEMAKRAKDLGSSAVFMGILMTFAIWLCVLCLIFCG